MKRLSRIIFLISLLLSCYGASAQELKIISFNIRYNSYHNIDGENGWPNRKAAVVRMINEEHPAAIGLQEALVDQLQYLDSCLPGYSRVGVGRDDGMAAGEFMAVYYDTTRLEVCALDTWWLSRTPEKPTKGWDAACYRTVTEVALRDRQSGKKFVYFNTHLDHVGKTARAEGSKFIASRVEGYSMPVIVGGDMNSTIDDTIFNAFYHVGLQVAREITDNTSNAITYNAFGGRDQSGNGVDGKVIDHFFVKDVKVVSFRTLDGDYGVPYISDHYPIEIVISL